VAAALALAVTSLTARPAVADDWTPSLTLTSPTELAFIDLDQPLTVAGTAELTWEDQARPLVEAVVTVDDPYTAQTWCTALTDATGNWSCVVPAATIAAAMDGANNGAHMKVTVAAPDGRLAWVIRFLAPPEIWACPTYTVLTWFETALVAPGDTALLNVSITRMGDSIMCVETTTEVTVAPAGCAVSELRSTPTYQGLADVTAEPGVTSCTVTVTRGDASSSATVTFQEPTPSQSPLTAILERLISILEDLIVRLLALIGPLA
jgi:hypothetical protein